MSTTSAAIAVAHKIETQRDKALAQLVTERSEASLLRVKIWALARELDDSLAMLAALRAREMQGDTCGPIQLKAEGWVNPRQGYFTRQDADEVVDRVADQLLQSPEMQQ